MSKLTLLVAAVALAACASSPGRSAAALEAQLPQLIAACNGAADAGSRQKKGMRACETLVNEKLLHLVEPDAFTAYWDYQANVRRWQACVRSQSHALIPVESRLSCKP